jgi:hypothetical protein
MLATVALVGFGVPSGASTPAAVGHGATCDPGAQGQSAARVKAGVAKGVDPNTVTSAQAAAMDRQLQRAVARMKARGTLDRSGQPAAKAKSYTVQTYVHVITRQDGTGALTRQQIADQMQVINDGFAGRTAPGAAATPFRFELAAVDVTANDDWYDWSLFTDTDDAEAKTALHRGGWADLNVYIAGLQDGLLGYATFPKHGTLALDGLVILNDSMPGGSAVPYNEGDTATHEIGHWLGLFHTFENGCKQPGDFVNDTPYQDDGDNIFFCRESDDTCSQPGTDPVHNFMSYGDDPCLDQFTPDQAKREEQTWLAYRRGR